MVDSTMAKMYLKWFDRIPTEFNKDKDFDTLMIGSFAGNGEKQMLEIAGNTLELELLDKSDNVQDWSISRETSYEGPSETIVGTPVMDEDIVHAL